MRLHGGIFWTIFVLGIVTIFVDNNRAEAFVKGTMITRSTPVSPFELNSEVAKKKKKKKKAAASGARAAKKKAPVETFRKPDFVASVAEKLDTSKADAADALTAVLETITENVVEGKKVSLPGFGTFQLRARAARKGRNPQTGEAIDIKASNSPGFTAAKAFKDRANE